MHYKIVKRSLTNNEVKILIDEIKKTPNISAYNKIEWRNCKNLFVAEDSSGKMLGACLNDDFTNHWTEIAALFVLEDYRNHGIGKDLFKYSLIDTIARQRNILAMSGNPFVVKMMGEYGLTIFESLSDLPDPYRKHSFTLNWFYELRWLMNWYRIVEVIRKKFVFKAKKKYKYGLMINSNV